MRGGNSPPPEKSADPFDGANRCFLHPAQDAEYIEGLTIPQTIPGKVEGYAKEWKEGFPSRVGVRLDPRESFPWS
jgi:hypothetical protein